MNIMKWFFPFLLFLPVTTGAQINGDTSTQKIRNFFWTTPVFQNTRINGLAVGLSPSPWRKAQKLEINGISISAAPWDPFFAVYMLVYANPFKRDSTYNREGSFNTGTIYPVSDGLKNSRNNGLFIGTITGADVFNGVNLSLFANASQTMNGLSVSGLFNHHVASNGVLIAGIRNKTTTARGLQLALFNNCKSGRLIQIGLLNTIGKRTTPLLNLQLNSRR